MSAFWIDGSAAMRSRRGWMTARVLRWDVLDADVDPVRFLRLGLQAPQDLRKIFRRQLLVVARQDLVEVEICGPLRNRASGIGKRARAQSGPDDLQRDAAVRPGHQ